MGDRASIIAEFLTAIGWSNATLIPLAGDASFRKYDRVMCGNKRAVLMDAPPDKEDIRQFIHITHHLRSLGYSAPEIYAGDTDSGLILLEDLKDTTFTFMLATGADETTLYECAVDLLIDLHSRPIKETVPAGLSLYDNEKFLEEALLLTDWYMPLVGEHASTAMATKSYMIVWQHLLPLCRAMTNTLVLRDFHADNLMWLPGRTGIASCGLLDYQDAVVGPPVYDLVSLLQDARRDIKLGLVEHLQSRYLSAFPKLDAEVFRQTFVVLAAQRHCKVIGIFTRLAVRDGKEAYLSHIPRVWRLLEAACVSPILVPLKEWLDQFIKPEVRGSALKEKTI